MKIAIVGSGKSDFASVKSSLAAHDIEIMQGTAARATGTHFDVAIIVGSGREEVARRMQEHHKADKILLVESDEQLASMSAAINKVVASMPDGVTRYVAA